MQKIYHGDRIAQCELRRNRNVDFVVCEEDRFDAHVKSVKEESIRIGGLGSTGR
jgi:dUTPase